MLKRFLIGFAIGIGATYWYLHNSDEFFSTTGRWFERSASGYRDDRTHEAIEHETGR